MGAIFYCPYYPLIAFLHLTIYPFYAWQRE